MFGGWQGIMSRKRPYTGIDWSGYVPQMNTPMADPGLVAANARVASGPKTPHTPMAGKKGLNWEEISEVMSEMQIMEPEFVTDQASQSGQDFKLSLMDQASPDVGNLGLSQEAFWKKKLGYA